MKRIDVRNKPAAELAKLLKDRRRGDLLEIIRRLASLEQHFSAEEIARARKTSKRAVIDDIKAGKLRGHKRSEYRWDASLTAVQEWDEKTAIRLPIPS